MYTQMYTHANYFAYSIKKCMKYAKCYTNITSDSHKKILSKAQAAVRRAAKRRILKRGNAVKSSQAKPTGL